MKRNKEYKRYKFYIFAILSCMWLGIIFSLSLQPAEESGETSREFGEMLVKIIAPGFTDELESMSQVQYARWDHIIRKCAHFFEYTVLGLLVMLAVFFSNCRKKVLRSSFLCFVSAAIDETIQLFVPGRAGQFKDVLLDFTGALTGVLILYIITKIMQGKRSG